MPISFRFRFTIEELRMVKHHHQQHHRRSRREKIFLYHVVDDVAWKPHHLVACLFDFLSSIFHCHFDLLAMRLFVNFLSEWDTKFRSRNFSILFRITSKHHVLLLCFFILRYLNRILFHLRMDKIKRRNDRYYQDCDFLHLDRIRSSRFWNLRDLKNESRMIFFYDCFFLFSGTSHSTLQTIALI